MESTEQKRDKRSHFIFYDSFYVCADALEKEDKLSLLDAILKYGLYGEMTVFESRVLNALMVLIKPQIDANYRKYQNAKKGGAPKGTVNNPKGRNQHTKTTTTTVIVEEEGGLENATDQQRETDREDRRED